jgi:hypothetical protein
MGKFGSNEKDKTVLPGGEGQTFYASIVVRMSPMKKIEVGKQLVGMLHAGYTRKNKTAQNYRNFEFNVMQQPFYGLDRVSELFKFGKELGLLTNREEQPYTTGACFFEGLELGKKKEEILQYLFEHDEVAKTLEDNIHARLNAAAAAPDTEFVDEDEGVIEV